MSENLQKLMKRIVLIVDDEFVVRDVLSRHLIEQGYDVVTAESGEQAIHYGETIDPDIVLMDIAMPGMGGIKTLRQLLTRRPELPVIMLTGETDTQIAQLAMNSGACDYLTKPFDLAVLDKTLKTHLIFSA